MWAVVISSYGISGGFFFSSLYSYILFEVFIVCVHYICGEKIKLLSGVGSSYLDFIFSYIILDAHSTRFPLTRLPSSRIGRFAWLPSPRWSCYRQNQLVQEGEPSMSLAQVLGSLLLPSPGQNRSEPDPAKPRHPVHPDGQGHPRDITSGYPVCCIPASEAQHSTPKQAMTWAKPVWA